MRRIVGIIMIATLLLVGCDNQTISSQPYLSSSSASSLTTSSINSSVSSSSDYVRTYADETHKTIQYGKLSIDFDDYHIFSDLHGDNTEIFQCELDKGETQQENNMTIKVREIEKQDFSNTESMVSYLGKIFPDYDGIKIYNNVTDDSGIISLYIIMGSKLTNYVVCYKDSCYLVESDYGILDMYLFKNAPAVNYEIDKQKIECADSFTTYVNETITNNKDEFEKAKYEIVQGKGGAKYSAELSRDEEFQNHFTLKNEKNKNLLTLSTYGEFNDVINFLDVNMDGYADIQFLEEPGTLNNSYALYVWDDSSNIFIKVKCEEMLSYFEVNDGCLRNWQKADAGSGVIQTLVWDKNTLVKVSEEPYQAE